MITNKLYMIIVLLATTIIAICIYDYITNKCVCTETFIPDDEYYSLNWTDPRLTDYVNHDLAYSRLDCGKHCTYSMLCDLTDDAYEYCYRSLDVPRYDADTGMYVNNSF